MKKFIAIFAIALLSSIGYAESVPDASDGVFETESTVIDLGVTLDVDYAITMVADQPAEIFVNQESTVSLFTVNVEQALMFGRLDSPVVNDVGKISSSNYNLYKNAIFGPDKSFSIFEPSKGLSNKNYISAFKTLEPPLV